MDEHEDISYKTLRRLQQAEQTSAVLQKIQVTFYQDLSVYIKNIERSIAQENNPLKLKVFTDEVQNTKKIASSIYELREKKIVQAALATARGASPDLKNLLDGEKSLFDALVAQISSSRKQIFEGPVDKQRTQPLVSPANVDHQKDHPNMNPIVRVLEDTPEFVGTDEQTYSLRKEDVLSLPAEMAEPLLKKGVVKQVK
ncbi:MAG: DNA replication complex GINS family protein [Candidatus Thermoplasmatota archaeon]|nr:DNA replication complex GINS family protein [Candidatus Thermoplasmatota archaeon]